MKLEIREGKGEMSKEVMSKENLLEERERKLWIEVAVICDEQYSI